MTAKREKPLVKLAFRVMLGLFCTHIIAMTCSGGERDNQLNYLGCQIVGEKININGRLEAGKHVFFDERMPPVKGFHHPDIRQVFIVPAGKILTLGDNRRNSKDSRYWGLLDENTVIGKAEIFYWSHDPRQGIFEGHRFERIGKPVN